MLPKLTENKPEISANALAKCGHALLVCKAGSSIADLPCGTELALAVRRRKLDADALCKTPVAVQLDSGTLVVLATLPQNPEKQSTFDTNETLRRALAVLLAEHPEKLTLAVFGDAAFKARAAEAALYVALVNAAELPHQKAHAETAVAAVSLHGCALKDAAVRVQAVAEGNVLCRHLTATAPNALTPDAYHQRIKDLAKTYGWTVDEYDFATLKKLGAGAFCAVAQGSPAKDAAILRIRIKGSEKKGAGKKAKPAVALVGKGVCFDTGGHNLKPSRSMYGMHEDMNGSAVVLGILAAATKMGTATPLEAWVGITENHIGPDAYKQNDVVRALNGTTIEIVHTDAEGRMVLADVLTLAAREKPGLIIDFATLTGAMHVAVGVRMSGIFATDSTLAHRASRAGQISGERVVAFPAPADYDAALDSKVADIKQCTADGEADHILATRFLSRFVGDTPWVHVDLAAHICKGGLGAVMTDTNGFGVAWGVAMLDACKV